MTITYLVIKGSPLMYQYDDEIVAEVSPWLFAPSCLSARPPRNTALRSQGCGDLRVCAGGGAPYR